MAGRSFASASADVEADPIEFDLGPGAEFAIARPLPGFPVAKLASMADEGGPKAIGAFLEFFEGIMEPEEFQRFKTEATKRRIDLEGLVEIGGYVVENGSGRPTQRRSDSSES